MGNIITKGYGSNPLIITKGYLDSDDSSLTPDITILDGYPIPQSVPVKSRILVHKGRIYSRVEDSNYYVRLS